MDLTQRSVLRKSLTGCRHESQATTRCLWHQTFTPPQHQRSGAAAAITTLLPKPPCTHQAREEPGAERLLTPTCVGAPLPLAVPLSPSHSPNLRMRHLLGRSDVASPDIRAREWRQLDCCLLCSVILTRSITWAGDGRGSGVEHRRNFHSQCFPPPPGMSHLIKNSVMYFPSIYYFAISKSYLKCPNLIYHKHVPPFSLLLLFSH